MASLRHCVRGSYLGIILLASVLVATLSAQNKPDDACTPRGIPGRVYRVGDDGATAPRVVHMVDPDYSEKARRAKVQGTVLLSLIVDASGDPESISVNRGLRGDLDEKAAEAVRQWNFEPGTLHGKPVAVALCVEIDFHMYK